MSLLSHLLRPLPFCLIGLAAISSAEEPAPTLPPAPAGFKYTKEQLAVKPVGRLLQQYARLMKLDGEGLTLRGQKEGKLPPTAAELAENRKTDAEKRAAAWKEINVLRLEVVPMLLDPETKAIAAPVVELHEVAKQLNDLYQQVFTLTDSGKSSKSPEVRAILEKASPLATRQTELSLKTLTEMKRVVGELADAKAAARANPNPNPGPAPAPAANPGTITPAKKSSKNDLPPGMTRK